MSEQVLGFVGVGRMGGPMANRLLDAGHTLCVFDTNADVVKPLAARGAKVASSAEEVASSSDMVLISLPTPPIVQAVSLGSILKGNRLKTLIDLSTTGPTVAGVVAKAASERGVAWVDSPVSGGIGGATKGTLAVMVSCRKDTFPVVDPVLKTFGKTFYVGEKPGLAQIAKLANNLLAAAAIVLSSEALAMGVKAGLDAKTLCDIINAGSGRNSATQDKFPKAVIPRTFDFGFALSLMDKDVQICLREARAAGLELPVGEAVAAVWREAQSAAAPGADCTEIVRLIEQRSGAVISS